MCRRFAELRLTKVRLYTDPRKTASEKIRAKRAAGRQEFVHLLAPSPSLFCALILLDLKAEFLSY